MCVCVSLIVVIQCPSCLARRSVLSLSDASGFVFEIGMDVIVSMPRLNGRRRAVGVYSVEWRRFKPFPVFFCEGVCVCP